MIGNVIDGSTHNCIECAQGEVGTVFCGNTLRNWAAEVGSGKHRHRPGTYRARIQCPGGTTEIVVLGNTFHFEWSLRIDWAAGQRDHLTRENRGEPVLHLQFKRRHIIRDFHREWRSSHYRGNSFNSCAYGIWVNSSAVATGVISTNSFWNLPTAFASRAINLAAAGDGWLIEQNCIDCDPGAEGWGS